MASCGCRSLDDDGGGNEIDRVLDVHGRIAHSPVGVAPPGMGATTRWLELRYSALETKLGRKRNSR